MATNFKLFPQEFWKDSIDNSADTLMGILYKFIFNLPVSSSSSSSLYTEEVTMAKELLLLSCKMWKPNTPNGNSKKETDENWFNTFNNTNISINWLFVNFPLGKASSYKLTVKVMFRSHDPRRVKLEYFKLGHLHDDVILLLRPESLSFFLLYLNLVIPARFKQQKS